MSQNANNEKSRSNASLDKERTKKKLLLAILVTFVTMLLVVAVLVFSEVGMAISKIANNNKNDNDPPSDTDQDDDKIDDPSSTEYTYITYSSSKVNLGELVLVNLSHKYEITTGVTDELVKIYDYRTANTPDGSSYYQLANAQYLKLNATAMESFHQMVKDFVAAYGDNSLMVTSAYRTLEDQEGKTTPPGYSEAHTGYVLALSIYKNQTNTALTPADPIFSWIYDNAYKYGFVTRYPEGKESVTGVANYVECLRYVGKLNAYIMQENNFCLEEYIEHLKKYTFDGEHFEVTDESGAKYELYFVPTASGDITSLPVPADSTLNPYTVSGTNSGGFVVTVKLQ